MGFGEALLKLGVDRKGLDEGLSKAEARTEKFGGKIKQSAWAKPKRVSKTRQSKCPIFGGMVSKLPGAAANSGRLLLPPALRRSA